MNAYGIIHNYDQPIYTPDFDFIQRALTYKQGTYNQNKERLDNVYKQLESLSVVKGVDQEHINERLRMIYDVTDKYATMDLSDTPFVDGIIANMNQLFDEPTKNAVLSSRVLRMEDAKWDWYKENQPEKYSELNRRYATEKLANRAAYLNDANVGSKYKGGADFIEYIDLNKNIVDRMRAAAKDFELEYVETGPQEGYFRHQYTKKTVPMDKLRDYYDMTLSDAERRQMGINAWGVYDKMPDDVIRNEYDTRLNNFVKQTDRQIAALELKLNGAGYTESQKEETRADIDRLKSIKSSTQNYSYDKMVSTVGRESTYTQLYSDKVKDKMTSMYYKDIVTKDQLDPVQKANVEWDRQIKRDAVADEKWLKEYELKVRKEDREDLSLRLKNSESFDADGNLVSNGGKNIFTPSKDGIEAEKKESQISSFYKQKSDAYQEIEKYLMGKGYTRDEIGKIVYNFNHEKEFDFKNFEFNGKNADLSDGAYELFSNYRDFSRQAIILEKNSFESIDKFADDLTETLSGVFSQRNPTIDGKKQAPNMGYYFESDNNGNLVAKVDRDGSMNAKLLKKLYDKKEDLTPAEKATLRMYAIDRVLGEGYGDDNEQSLLKAYRKNMLAGVSNSNIVPRPTLTKSEQRFLNSELKTYSDLLIKNGKGSITAPEREQMLEAKRNIESYRNTPALKTFFHRFDNYKDYSKGFFKANLYDYTLDNITNYASKWIETIPFGNKMSSTIPLDSRGSLSTLGRIDADYTDVNLNRVDNKQSVKSMIKNRLGAITTPMENSIKEAYALQPMKWETNVPIGSDLARVIAQEGGFSYDKSTIITASRVWSKEKQDFLPNEINYTVSNPLMVKNKTRSKDGFAESNLKGTLSEDVVKKNPTLLSFFADAKRTPYDIKLGKYALDRSLGTNFMSDNERMDKAITISGRGKTTLDSEDTYLRVASDKMLSRESKEVLKGIYEDYERGNYTFKLAPNNNLGSYVINVEKDGDILVSYQAPGLSGEMSQAEVNAIQGVYKTKLLDDAFNYYLEYEIEKIARRELLNR